MAPNVSSPTPSVVGVPPSVPTPPAPPVLVEAQEGLRVPPPDKYDRKPASLEEFIIKSRIYIGFQNHRFKYDIERVLFIITRFEGRAYS
jgi:hypothetical protein